MKKKTIILSAAALALTASLTVGGALAYFTTYSTATGGYPMEMGFTETVPHEEVSGGGKHITIENTGDYECFVRVKVFSPVEISYDTTEGWTLGADDYWYYTGSNQDGKEAILPARGVTSELFARISFPEFAEDGSKNEFDVVVVQECTPVTYDEDGNPVADWNLTPSDDSQE
ncbi:MAG: hypothetical protein PHC41_05395 [Lachnospiraceae bacterium]|nr:hypothetical protein [Lachnospiraceae bacterium]